jgi:hypothetical protein
MELHDEVDCSSDIYVTSARRLAVQVVKYNHVIQKRKTQFWASVQTFSILQFIPSWSTFVKSSDKVTIKFWKSRRTRSSFDRISLSKVLTSKVQRHPSWGAVPPRDNRTGVQTSLLTCFGATRNFILCFFFQGTIELGSKLQSWLILDQQGVSFFVFFFPFFHRVVIHPHFCH